MKVVGALACASAAVLMAVVAAVLYPLRDWVGVGMAVLCFILFTAAAVGRMKEM